MMRTGNVKPFDTKKRRKRYVKPFDTKKGENVMLNHLISKHEKSLC